MTLEVLVATMEQTDHSLLEKMNIRSDAIVVNQCDRYQAETFDFRGHRVRWFSCAERGVGLSRNTALMRAQADIVLFADDDLRYSDAYAQEILRAFEDNPRQDVLIFDVKFVNDTRSGLRFRPIKKQRALHWYNAMRYGACRIAARRKALLKNNIFYTLLFGGGAAYSAGEDSLLLKQCFNKRLKCMAYPLVIAQVDMGHSSWYKGPTETYFKDKGALFYAAFPKLYPLIYVYYALRDRKQGGGFRRLLRLFAQGRRAFRNDGSPRKKEHTA